MLEKRAIPRGARAGRSTRPRSRARRAWVILSACQGTDPELFYACQSSSAREQAKAVCAACPVRPECLESVMEEEADPDTTPYSNRKNRFGIRAGLTSDERWALAYPREAREAGLTPLD